MGHFPKGLYGEQQLLRIKLRVDGILMEREKVFGIPLFISKEMSLMDQQQTLLVIGNVLVAYILIKMVQWIYFNVIYNYKCHQLKMNLLHSYNLYKQDVALLKSMNLTSYRFSISWPRVIPQVSTMTSEFSWKIKTI